MIPKVIHHIWLQGGLPPKYEENYKEWSKLGYPQKIWSQDDILIKWSGVVLPEIYANLDTLINKVNFLKYILMFMEGGIFVDLDTRPTKHLDHFFKERVIHDIDKSSKMSIRYPYNTRIPHKPFGEYDIIIPGRDTLMHFPDHTKATLLDNPVLMSRQRDEFWIRLRNWCANRKNLKEDALFSTSKHLPHEPYGPYGLTDYLYNNYKEPYLGNILILPPAYLLTNISSTSYISHAADRGW